MLAIRNLFFNKFPNVTLLLSILGFALLILLTPLHAKDTALKPPDPEMLNTEELVYFDASGKELENRIAAFSEQLSKIQIKTDSPEGEELSSLISKINLSLKTLIASKTKTEPSVPIYPPLEASYSINSLVELHRSMRKKNIELKSLRDELQEKKRYLDSAQSNFDRQVEAFRKLSEPSDDRLDSALKTIYSYLLLKIGTEEQKKIETKITIREQELSVLKDQLVFAENHLSVSQSDIRSLKEEARTLKETWQRIQSEHQSKEAELLIDSSEINEPAKDAQRVLRQEALKSNLDELSAKQDYLFAEIKLTLALLNQDAKQVDLSKIGDTLHSWEQSLKSTQHLVNSWLLKSQKAFQRTGQLISLDSGANQKESSQALKLAQKNLLALQGLLNETDDSEFLIGAIKNKVAKVQGHLSLLLFSFLNFLSAASDSIAKWFETSLFHVGMTPITISGIVRFSLILLVTLLLSRFLIRTLSRYAIETKKAQRAVVYRLSRLLHYFVLTVGIILALSAIGFDFSSLLLVAGALGVGLGFGLQSIFNNFISGIIMLFESQLKIGDFIELTPDLRGEIREINVRTTILSTNDGVEVIVPNAEIISNKIVNWTLKHPFRRFHIPFSVAYGTDPQLVKEVVAEAAKRIPHTLEKPGFSEPIVLLTKFGENSLDFELLVWVNEKYSKIGGTTTSDYLIAINSALTENNIVQPFPHRDLSIGNLLGAKSLNELSSFLKKSH